jgi:hypothetical protein
MGVEHPLYIATLRAVYRASDDVEAIMIADQIKVNGEADLEEGDSLDVTQVTQNTLVLSAAEVTSFLRRARNLLIRTRVQYCYDVAREVDKCIFMLDNRSEREVGIEFAGYDWGKFLDIAKEVLDGGNPIH